MKQDTRLPAWTEPENIKEAAAAIDATFAEMALETAPYYYKIGRYMLWIQEQLKEEKKAFKHWFDEGHIKRFSFRTAERIMAWTREVLEEAGRELTFDETLKLEWKPAESGSSQGSETRHGGGSQTRTSKGSNKDNIKKEREARREAEKRAKDEAKAREKAEKERKKLEQQLEQERQAREKAETAAGKQEEEEKGKQLETSKEELLTPIPGQEPSSFEIGGALEVDLNAKFRMDDALKSIKEWARNQLKTAGKRAAPKVTFRCEG